MVAERVGDTTRLVTLRSEVPLVLREADGALWLVGGAAGPLAGDELSLEVVVGAGAHLLVRSTAASILLGGPGPGPSRLSVTAEVGDGAELVWLPEPTVATSRCSHEAITRVSLAGSGRLIWRDEVIAGRSGEGPGTWWSRLMVDIDGTPCCRQDLGIGPGFPGWSGPAVMGSYRAVGSALVVRPRESPRLPVGPLATGEEGVEAESMATACGRGRLITAVAASTSCLRSLLDRALSAEVAERQHGWPQDHDHDRREDEQHQR